VYTALNPRDIITLGCCCFENILVFLGANSTNSFFGSLVYSRLKGKIMILPVEHFFEARVVVH
jgi:hypothetical protein